MKIFLQIISFRRKFSPFCGPFSQFSQNSRMRLTDTCSSVSAARSSLFAVFALSKGHTRMVSTSTSPSPQTDDMRRQEGSKTKTDRKLVKRRNKLVKMVQKDIGLTVSPDPSNWLVLWGIGFATGTPKKDVYQMFEGPVEIRYFKDKSYCFLRYEMLQDARRVEERFQEEFLRVSLQEVNPVKRLIGFVNEEPPNEDLQLIESFFKDCPGGLKILNDFISQEEENEILQRICPESSESVNCNDAVRSLKHRWVRHFGYEFWYGSNDIDYDNPLPEEIPDYLDPVMERMKKISIFPEYPDQLTVNQYQSGQGIPPHCDTHSCFEGAIVSLSLGSKVLMNFRRGNNFYSVILQPRSLLVMDGDIRFGWTHGIANRTFDIVPDVVNQGIDISSRGVRTSLTFRRLRRSRVCNCSFATMCDSQNAKISEENAGDLESKLVHKVYENIAPHFHETRHTPWPKVTKFIEDVADGGVILDVGCGNGKYFNLNRNTVQIGTDMSLGLLDICRTRCAEVVRANALQIPFKDESFHAVICIAVLHHISTKARRIAVLHEFLRVLISGGQALIYVWSKDQRHEDEASVYAKQSKESKANKTTVNPCDLATTDFAFLPIHDRQTQDFSQNDVLVPWVNVQDVEKAVHHRYYHVFDKGELEALVGQLQPVPKIVDSYYDQGNWVVRLQRS